MSEANRAILQPGTIIAGRYRIEGTVGRGGFGAVYDAIQLDSGRRVALKILLKNFSTSKTDARRFQREAALVQKLRHPNVVDIYDFGYTVQGQPYIAFELLQGTSLGDTIKADGALDFKRACDVARDVLKALSAAHGVGIIHRDIKPQNIFLCQHGPAKVLDFGIAKAVRGKESQATQLTETGQMLGTPQYMAPEQVRGAEIVPATDLYALGLLTAEMVSGERVVSGGALIDVYMAHITDDPFELPEAVTRSRIGRVIRKAICKSLDERYTSADEMLADFEAALAGRARAIPKSGVGGTTQMPEIAFPADHDPLSSTVLMTETTAEMEDEDSLAQTAFQAPSSRQSTSPPLSLQPLSVQPLSLQPNSQNSAHGTMVMDSGDHAAHIAALKASSVKPASERPSNPLVPNPSLDGTIDMGPASNWQAGDKPASGPAPVATSAPSPSLRHSMHEGTSSVPPGLLQPPVRISEKPSNPAPIAPPQVAGPKPASRWWIWLLLMVLTAALGVAAAMWGPW